MVLDSLNKDKIINDVSSFAFLARIMKYDEKIKPGHYELQPEMSNREAIIKLRSGMQTPVDLTFNNVRLDEELAIKITNDIMLDAEEFLEYLQDSTFIAGYGFTPQTIKCMFIPNTYEVYWTITAEELFDRMNQEYQQFWNVERQRQAAELELSTEEICTLASIVQAETKMNEESKTVAGLYLNRIKRGMLLQADPTLIYAHGDYSIRRVLNKHKEIDSPYNTYLYPGLPPGPINSPSIHSIDAVLNHEDHSYLYMVAKEDFSGYHYFSKSLSQHLEYAKRYQRALNKARLYR